MVLEYSACSAIPSGRQAFPNSHTTEWSHRVIPVPLSVPFKDHPGKESNEREQKTRSFTIFLCGRSILFLYNIISLGQKEGAMSL